MDTLTRTYYLDCPNCKEKLEIYFFEDQITDGPNRMEVIRCYKCKAEFEFTCIDGLIVPSQQNTEPDQEEEDDDEEDDDEEDDDEEDGDEEDDDEEDDDEEEDDEEEEEDDE